jgi:hypothetical protein
VPNPLRWLASLPWETRALLIVCGLGLLLRLWPLGGGSLDYDEGVYWQSLRALSAGHPLFTDIFSSQPPGFLLCIYPFYLLFGQSLVAARLAIMLYSLAGLVAMYLLGRAIGGRWTGIVACALLAVDPLYLIESRTLQAEAPSVAFQLACVALAALAMRRTGRARHLLALASGVALGLGVMVKLFDVVAAVPALMYLLLPVGLVCLDEMGRLRRPARRDLVHGAREALPDVALLVVGTVGAMLLVLLPYLPHWGAVYDQVVAFHLRAGHAFNYGLLHNLQEIARAGEEYPVFIVAVVAVAFAVYRRDWRILPPALWLLVSFIFLVQQQPLLDHHRVLLSAPLALTAAVGLAIAASVWPNSAPAGKRRSLPPDHQRQRQGVAMLALTGLTLIAGLAFGLHDARISAQPPTEAQMQMVVALERLTVPGAVVVCDDQYIAGLADRNVPPELVDTSLVRIRAGYLTATQLEAAITRSNARAILFASGRFELIPGFKEWVQANFPQQVNAGDGHILYMKAPTPSSAPV